MSEITPEKVSELLEEGIKCHIASGVIVDQGNLYQWLQHAPNIAREYFRLHKENRALKMALDLSYVAVDECRSDCEAYSEENKRLQNALNQSKQMISLEDECRSDCADCAAHFKAFSTDNQHLKNDIINLKKIIGLHKRDLGQLAKLKGAEMICKHCVHIHNSHLCEVEEAEDESKRLREVLEFYANVENYCDASCSLIDTDQGAIAREALKEPK